MKREFEKAAELEKMKEVEKVQQSIQYQEMLERQLQEQVGERGREGERDFCHFSIGNEEAGGVRRVSQGETDDR